MSGAENSRRYRERHPEKVKAYNTAWRERNREHTREYARRRYREDPSRQAHAGRRALYGLTPSQWAALREASDGLCAVCYEVPATHVDHDHKTGKVRGAVCRKCNLGLGHLDDDPARLRAAAEYLEYGPVEVTYA